jgi:alkylhydroperoxidase family enzyme
MAEIPSIAKDTLTIVQGLSERERIALEYAGRVSATPIDVPDDFFARLRPRFSEREIVELTAHIAQENYNAKSNRPLRVDANNFCEIPLPASKT